MVMERYEVHGVKVYQLNICEADARSPSLPRDHDTFALGDFERID